MSKYEQQILETGRRNDHLISEIEQSGETEILHSVMAYSRLHRIIHNPVTEGIDEG
ncbi:hypothetical protein [Sedimenticola sp.]|uniref:hypothetical protein n=1 Tax=Sedimenticola sp. TaxID=1940285 RepID=UPI00258A038B|nr:hypothetical protein [Sedimenticola sp.]MCW8902336.1 hypothetical protein [Sedimenticola sp.]